MAEIAVGAVGTATMEEVTVMVEARVGAIPTAEGEQAQGTAVRERFRGV